MTAREELTAVLEKNFSPGASDVVLDLLSVHRVELVEWLHEIEVIGDTNFALELYTPPFNPLTKTSDPEFRRTSTYRTVDREQASERAWPLYVLNVGQT